MGGGEGFAAKLTPRPATELCAMLQTGKHRRSARSGRKHTPHPNGSERLVGPRLTKGSCAGSPGQ